MLDWFPFWCEKRSCFKIENKACSPLHISFSHLIRFCSLEVHSFPPQSHCSLFWLRLTFPVHKLLRFICTVITLYKSYHNAWMKCLYLLFSLTEDGYVDTVTTHSTVQMVPLPCLLCVEHQSQYFGISLTLCLLGCLKNSD